MVLLRGPVLAAARQDQNTRLTCALESNRQIGVAMGILTAGGKLTEQQVSAQAMVVSQCRSRFRG